MSEPIHIISLGAGVQSSTMALMAAHGEITPMPKCAIFADTQDEPQSVYKWLDWLEKQLPFPIHRVTFGHLFKDELRIRRSKKSGKLYRKTGIPAFLLKADGKKGMLGRTCTLDYKIRPLQRKVKEIVGIKRSVKRLMAVVWIGISRDEAHRIKPSRVPYIEHRWPLVDQGVTRDNCLTWMSGNGLPTPPRSACKGCPFHSDYEWKDMKDNRPDEFQEVVLFERKLREAHLQQEALLGIPFLHESCIPLDQVNFENRPSHSQLSLFGNECSGLCGV